MISEEEARAKILSAVAPLPATRVSLGDALDRFAATDLFATIPLPPFDNSAMDGYAVVAGSAGRNARLKIVGEQPAGPSKNLSLSASEAVRIFTGAPIPTGADAVTMQRHSPDNFDTLCTILRDAVQHDALIISGGVSVGEHDLVREALREIGAEIDLWRVAVKPGKPFLFGKRDRCLIFGLPGNPVSAFVTFLTFVRPALLQMMGATNAALTLPRASACLTHEVTGDETRPHYFRGELSGTRFTVIGPQESHALFGLARSNALLRVPPGETLGAGSEVEVLLIH